MFLQTAVFAQSNVTVRVMAANLNGNTQSYQPFAIRLFQGLLPDVVAIQEFNYTSTNGANVNNAAAFREMVDLGFGTNYIYFREPTSSNGDIPNGIISRYPIIASGSWTDTLVANRGFAWAQIDLPGTNDLYIVSVHLLTSSSANRASEAANLKTLMQANFPANAWIVVAGDFNAGSRSEACVTTWNGYLTDFPIPVDKNGVSDTSANRNSPHDYLLPSLTMTNFETATVYGPLSYPNGLVFDSRVYTNSSDLINFSPVQLADSGLAQHMAVIKDFSILASPATNPPVITAQPLGKTNAVGSTISFSVTATGSGPLTYQWRLGGTNILGATSNPFTLANIQLTNNGNYSVLITNAFGSVTSSIAVLLVTNAPPAITTQPSSQTVLASQPATFSVAATGTAPLNFQWLFGGTNISGATTNPFVIASAQSGDAGNYSVIITNATGSVTSSPAALTVLVTNPAVFVQWNFNSVSPDTNTGTGSTLPAVGTGTATAIGGVAASFVGGDSSLDPAGTNDNTAWTTVTYPASSANNKTAGVQFAISTAGKQNITISYSIRSSNTGGKYFRLQYSTNGGAAFLDSPFVATLTAGATFFAFTNNLALPGVDNNSNFVFRLVAEFQITATGTGSAAYIGAGGTYATGGTTRFDMVTVSGTSLVTGGAATLSSLTFTNGVFTLGVTGTLTAGYVLQTSTNLGSTNWLPVFTNASPFSFSESNLLAPQKFYRAVAQ
jgi:endonuclease/exonuclease/phosphatase family metal-dependent hydrolase